MFVLVSFISVNHRLAEFLASYFDILFAVNEVPHPGEKKLLRIAKESCKKLPEHFENDMLNLVLCVGKTDANILSRLDATIENLDSLLVYEELYDIVS